MRLGSVISLAILCAAGIILGALYATALSTDSSADLLSAEDATLIRFNAACADIWARVGVEPVAEVADLEVLRRLTLALHGVIPSLAQIRNFEADTRGDRLRHWTLDLVEDPKFANHFAERFARALVDTAESETDLYDRSKLVGWLAGRFADNRPFDETVRQLVSTVGSPTYQPAVNFVTAAMIEDQVNLDMLTRRTSRALLGQRIDCARCHDDFFSNWKQDQFEGLAAYFAQVTVNGSLVQDDVTKRLEADLDGTQAARSISACLPFESVLGEQPIANRDQLATWITCAENRRFPRAIVNRVSAILLGRPLHSPVDDMPDPGVETATTPLIDILAQGFVEGGYDIKHLVQVVAASRPFRLSSRYEVDDYGAVDKLLIHFAAFSMTRLLPEQAYASLIQASSVRTMTPESHPVQGLYKLAHYKGYTRQYGDFGIDEYQPLPITVEQVLLQMNGAVTRDTAATDTRRLANRVARLASSNERCLESCFLICLTRRPTDSEREYFLPQFRSADDTERVERVEVVAEIVWSLVNSPEFLMNH